MSNTARRTSVTYPNGRVLDLSYGATGSIDDLYSLVKSTAISGESGNKVEYTRAGLARFVKVAYPQPGVEMSMIRPGGGSEGDSGDPYDGYDRFSRVQEMRWQNSSTGTPVDAWQWGFNEASNRTWKKNLVAATGEDEAYAYDGLYQVKRDAVGTINTNRTAIGGAPKENETFTYDPTGNWLGYRKDANGSPVLDQTRSNNQDNQLTQIDGSSEGIEYDRAGNAIKIRPGAGGDWNKHFTLVWDAWNRLVEVKDENGATVQKNAYDGLSRRITKETGGTVTHTYWSDRWKSLEERIGSATTAARSYLWGERPGHRDELVLRDRDTDGNGTLDERHYATMDYFNGTAVMNASGTVLERYAYAAFGEWRIMAADFTPRTTSSYAWDFGFQGQFRDFETGWSNYGYRFYVPLLGTWINRDPIGENGGFHIYNFVNNRPIDKNDYFGLAEPLENNGLGPRSPFQSPGSNCGGLAVSPQTTKENNATGGRTEFNPSPENMLNPTGGPNKDRTPGAGCRSVKGPDECKTTKPDCERHVIVYTPRHQGWDKGLPNYHTVGQSTCGKGNYYHQSGKGGTVFGPLDDPGNVAPSYYTGLPEGGPPPPLKEEHYCCPNDQ
jgi:RHS repeat-associated protein